jgi:hypothetical protein
MIRPTVVLLAVGCGFSTLGAALCWAVAIDQNDRDEKKYYESISKRLFKIGFWCALGTIVIPCEGVVWKMWIASKMTPANIQEAGVVTADIAQKALDLITDSAIKIIQEVKK